ncbi:MAG TPA: hypothetical protein VF021_11290 [Longimicrobiales bacterium]
MKQRIRTFALLAAVLALAGLSAHSASPLHPSARDFLSVGTQGTAEAAHPAHVYHGMRSWSRTLLSTARSLAARAASLRPTAHPDHSSAAKVATLAVTLSVLSMQWVLTAAKTSSCAHSTTAIPPPCA